MLNNQSVNFKDNLNQLSNYFQLKYLMTPPRTFHDNMILTNNLCHLYENRKKNTIQTEDI